MYETAQKYGILLDEQIKLAIESDAVVACGVSGGKDSDALALKLRRFLDAVGHDRTRRVLIHSDLGEIEHADSLPQCKRLASKVEMPLIIVRPRFTMLERWEKRYADNLARYCRLSCVKLITPFSSAQWRFCTSELKIAPICQELKRRFPGQIIVNAVGIRGEESDARKAKPISKINKKLISKRNATTGLDWNPIRDVLIEEVWLTHRAENFSEHECYSKNGNSRCSCCCCVLAPAAEIRASMTDERNHYAYRRIVALEIKSTFSFSQSFWLADICPELLDGETLELIVEAKEKAAERRLIEAEIPTDLLYVKNDFPRRPATWSEAELVASVRRRIGALMRIPVKCTTQSAVYDRYAELFALKELKKQKTKLEEKL
jgi:3'-phosphoadenosine 5'-phosphosulfate sulfotransferase (PAPS reductase)/FAD synthetase